MSYDGFISYSHAADDLLAPRLQSGLQRFAKPWWKRRALRVFRDESSLSANPHLWESITEALDTSGWFVLLLSPDAAQSEWVNQEISYWVEHKDASRILPVVTAGEFGWADGDVSGDAVPDALRGVLTAEPRWVDLRFARGEEQLDLQDPRFADAIADVASAMRGVPKDELAGEEVRQHRRTIRTAWAAGALLVALLIISAFAGTAASRNAEDARANAEEAQRQADIADLNAQDAESQRKLAEENAAEAQTNADEAETQRAQAETSADQARAEALAAAALNQIEIDAERAVLLALMSLEISETPNGLEVLHKALQGHRTLWTYRFPNEQESYSYLHPDGEHVLVSTPADGLSYWDAVRSPGEPLWTIRLDGGSRFASTGWFDVVENTVTVALFQYNRTGDGEEPLDQGLYTFDLEDGSLLDVAPFGECAAFAWTADGVPEAGILLAQWPEDRCATRDIFEGDPSGPIVFLAEAGSDGIELALPPWEALWIWPSIAWDGSAVALSTEQGAYVFDTANGSVVHRWEPWPAGNWRPTLSPDGSHLLAHREQHVALLDLDTGEVLRTFPGDYSMLSFSPDGESFIGLSYQQGVEVFDLETGRRELNLNGPLTRPWDLATSPGVERIVVGSPEDVRLWNLESFIGELPSPVGKVLPSAGPWFSAMRIETGLLHVPGQVDGIEGYAIYDLSTGELVRERPGAWARSRIAPNGFVLEFPVVERDDTGGRDRFGAPQLVDARSGDVQLVIPGTCSFWASRGFPGLADYQPGEDCSSDDRFLPPGDIEFSGDGSRVAMATHTQEVVVYDFGRAEFVWDVDLSQTRGDWQPAWQVALSNDGSLVAHYLPADFGDTLAYEIELVDINSGIVRGAVDACNPSDEMEFVDADSLLVVTDWCADVRVYDVDTLAELQVFKRGQGGALTDLATSGERYATTGYDGNVRVWDATLGKVILEVPFDVPTEFLDSVEFIDHDRLLVAFDDGSTIVLSLDVEELKGVAVERLTRGLTEQECTQFDIRPCPTLEELRSP